MYQFKKDKIEEVLQGRTIKYVATKILDVHPFYLSKVLNGNIGCSKRLAKDILECISKSARMSEYFIIKEK